MKNTENLSREDRKMLNSIFWRSFFCQASRAGGQTRQHAIGFVYSIAPALDRYYKDDKEAKIRALIRHTQFFNITSIVSTLVMGIIASMERENSRNSDFDEQSIVALKVALMGPMSGIGDSIFIGVVRVIAAGIAVSLASTGSLLGPIIFLLIYNVPGTMIRYYLTYLGFTSGAGFISKIYESGMMKVLTKSASILGLIMVGAMTASTVTFKTAITIPMVDADPVQLQTYLDAVFKGLVPLGITLGCKYALDKKINVNWLMIGVLVLAMVLALLRIV